MPVLDHWDEGNGIYFAVQEFFELFCMQRLTKTSWHRQLRVGLLDATFQAPWQCNCGQSASALQFCGGVALVS